MNNAAVPFNDITRFEPGFVEGFLAKVDSLVRHARFAGGPEIAECEAALARHTQSAFAIGCANGTDAIQLALRAAGVRANDLVLLPDMTFWATFEAVVNVGARPITLDIHPETLHLDLATVQEALDRFRPRALILVHLYGWAAPDTVAIRKLCAERNVLLIEDCAQAFGVTLEGRSLIGDAAIATTSFYPAKVLGASGDAGAVFTSNPEWKSAVDSLRNHGRSAHYSHGLVGWNSRLGAYEASFLTHSLVHIDRRLDSRRRVCKIYRDELGGLPYRILGPAAGTVENGYCSVGLIDSAMRPRLMQALTEARVGFGTIYPGAMSRQEAAPAWLADKIDHGNADRVAHTVLNLPCFAYMRDAEVERVVNVVKAACRAL